MQKQFNAVINGKGGVGKSFFAVNFVQFLKDNGVAFTEIQYAAFRKAVEPVYTLYRSRLGSDLFDQFSRADAAEA